jgi:hypothetical protein
MFEMARFVVTSFDLIVTIYQSRKNNLKEQIRKISPALNPLSPVYYFSIHSQGEYRDILILILYRARHSFTLVTPRMLANYIGLVYLCPHDIPIEKVRYVVLAFRWLVKW